MNRSEAREKARALVARMTLEEKASQLRYDAPAIERLGIPAYNWWNEALHGVARVRLAPGERREAALPLSDTAFTVVDEDGVRRPGRGRWTLYAGFGQPDARTQELSGQVCRCVSIL